MQGFDYNNQPGRALSNRYATQGVSPLVSIITPFYNSIQYFEQTFCCVMNQTFPYFEWILIDDGSTDAYAVEHLRSFALADERIRVVAKENEGPAAARNFGVRQATTEFLVFLDADDLIEPTFLETLYLALQQNPEAAWSYSDTVTFGARCFLWKKYFSSDVMKRENLLVVTAMLRKTAFDKVGGFDVMGRYYNEDWHLWLKLLAQREFPVHVQQYLFWYRNMEKGAMAALDNNSELVELNRQKIAEIAQKVPDGITAVEYNGHKTGCFADVVSWDGIKKLPFAKKKIRILLILPHMVMGGADRFNLDMLKRLPRDRYEVSIVTTLPEENDWGQYFSQYAEDIFALPFFLDKAQWPAFLDYIMVTRAIDIVFNTNSYYAYFAIPWLHSRHPDVAFIDYIHMEEWYYRNGGFVRPSSAVAKFLDRTYVCNSGTRQVLVKDFARLPEDVETVYIGVDEKKFDPNTVTDAAVEEIRKEYGATGRPVILFPCRICAQKRPFLMLEIAKRLPECLFIVVGDGPQLEELQQKARQMNLENSVRFAGRQNDMRRWYKAADITLICSLKEGLSLTAYESLSMETPVVTSDVGGQAELVDETVGRVVPLLQDEATQEDNRSFASREIALYVDAIREILSSPEEYRHMADRCRERILQRFTVDHMGETMRREFERLVTPQERAIREKKIGVLAGQMPLYASYVELYADFEEFDAACAYFSTRLHALEAQYAVVLQAQAELDRMNQMKSVRVALAYQRLMNRPFLRRFRAVLARIWHALKE